MENFLRDLVLCRPTRAADLVSSDQDTFGILQSVRFLITPYSENLPYQQHSSIDNVNTFFLGIRSHAYFPFHDWRWWKEYFKEDEERKCLPLNCAFMKQARGLIIEKKKKENVLSIKGPYGGKHCWVNKDLVVISGSVPL